MIYKGIEQASELELDVEVVGMEEQKATYTITAWQNISDDAVSVKLSTEEVTRLRDHLSFILVHNDRHKEWAAKYFLEGLDVDNPDNEAIEYVHKPMSKEALAEVTQLEPRYMQHTTEKEE